MIAALVLAFTYIALSVGRVPGLQSDRLAACIIGGVLIVALRVLSLDEARAAVDGSTIGLLFGMMILSAALEVSGAFGLAGHFITRSARGPTQLLVGIAVVSAVLSAFLINDVVCIAFTPLVLSIAERVERDPKPYLLALATSSNIGSTATITGNPQNILIGSLSHIPYARFAATLAPVAIVGLVIDVAIIRYAYRRELGNHFAGRLEAPTPDLFMRWIYKSSVVLGGVMFAFIAGVPPVIAALLGASAMLVTRAVNPKRLYVRVDWTLLALFVGLFVVVAGAEKAGLAERALEVLAPLRADSVWGLTAISAVLSNVVSNVPAVMVLKSSVPQLSHPDSAWLTLAMSSTLAGNLTLPGSLATIIVVERARGSSNITWWDFAKVGVPTGLASLVVGAAWLQFLR